MELRKRAGEANVASAVAQVAARGIANLIRDHLFAKDASSPNALGGKRSHFYSGAAKSMVNVASGDGVAITINQIGLAQRWLGGTIRAGAGTSTATGGPTKYLAIPARAEAYGRTPGEFDDLRFVPTRRGGMLVQALQTSFSMGKKGVKGGAEKGGLVFFWLVTEVTQRADPSVLPTEGEMMKAGVAAGESYLARALGTK